MQDVGLKNYELEIIEVHLKRSEFETKVVQLIKAILEIDRLLKQQETQGQSASTASAMKEAA